jgi:hypothetical protein
MKIPVQVIYSGRAPTPRRDGEGHGGAGQGWEEVKSGGTEGTLQSRVSYIGGVGLPGNRGL